MKSRSRNPYSKMILFLTLTGVVLVVGAILIFRLANDSIKKAKAVDANYEAANAYEQRLADLSSLKDEYDNLLIENPEISATLYNAVPVQVDYPRYLIYLRNLRDSVDPSITISSVNLVTSASTAKAKTGAGSTAGPKRYAVTAELNGLTWDSLVSFLDQVQHGSRFTNVTSLSIQGGAVLKGSLKLEIYSQESAVAPKTKGTK